MKHLNPSHREKKRYLLLEGNEKMIDRAVLDYVGILGYAKASPKIIQKYGTGAILAVNRKELDKIRAAFLFFDIKILKVSGTLKKLKN